MKSNKTDNNKKVCFINPDTQGWETADEYLSGNVREKLRIAEKTSENGDLNYRDREERGYERGSVIL